jgi:regulation of enolase protein 1 (concanavalin A-like superfamily)
VVSPDGTWPEENRPEGGRTALFAGAALVIAVGFGVLGFLTSPDEPVAVATTTSHTTTTIPEIQPPIDPDNFTVGQIATGQPLHWERVGSYPGHPLALTEHDGAMYLFTSPTSPYRYERGGLDGWRSSDGADWEALGRVIDDGYRVSIVRSTDHGLVAAGTNADGSSLVIWTSSNGKRWESVEFSDETDFWPNRHYPLAIGANEDLLVVATNHTLDGQALIQGKLDEAGIAVNLSELGWSTDWRGDEGHWLVLHAPLGLQAMEIPLDQFDLSPDELQWIVGSQPVGQEAGIWVRSGEGDWALASIEGVDWIESIVTRADGSMVMVGWGPAGRVSRLSRDGVIWADYDADPEPRVMDRWGSRLVGIEDFSRPELLVSDDGVSWEQMGLADRFPSPIQWHVGSLGSGDDGVALSVTGYHNPMPVDVPEMPSEITTEEGHVLSLDLMRGVIELTAHDNTYSWDLYRTDLDAGIEVDPVARTVTLSDTDTGEVLAALSFEDLTRAERDYYTERFQHEEHLALVFTADGSEWIIQPATTAFDGVTWVASFEVAFGHLYAAVFDPAEAYNPFVDEFEFQLWVAEIP